MTKTFDGSGPSLFVTGSSRSGTELLRSLLNRHPEVHIAAETHYFEDLRPRLEGRDAATTRVLALDYFAALRGSAYGLGGAEAHVPRDRAVSELVAEAGPEAGGDALFRAHCRIAAREAGRPRPCLWGEKTPRHVFSGAEILETLPEARIVHMLRDPRAVAASYRDWENHWYDDCPTPEALRTALDREARRVRATRSATLQALSWRAATAAALALRKRYGSERVRIQGFEALIACPEAEIAELCAFAGLSQAPGMDQVGRVNSSYGGVGEGTGMDAEVTERWRGRLSPAEVWWIEKLTDPPARRLGYALEGGSAHLGFAAAEIVRTALRLPGMMAANWGRSGHHAKATWTRIRAVAGNFRL